MEKPNDRPESGDWRPLRETAPSTMRADEPTVARLFGMWGLMFAVLGALAIFLTSAGFRGLVGYGLGSTFVALGLVLLLFHAASDRDLQIRRAYGIFGAVLLAAGIVLPWIPYKDGTLFAAGYPCLALGLCFLLAFHRHEGEAYWSRLTTNVLGGVGAAMALIAFIGGNISADFLLPRGSLLGLLGLVYLSVYVVLQGADTDRGYWAGRGMGIAGLVVAAVAIIRTGLGTELHYFVPTGATLLGLGILYEAGAQFLCSDNALVIMTRRELAAYFYSPIAYLVLIGMTVIAGVSFFLFLEMVSRSMILGDQPVMEPIVGRYFNVMTIICLIFIVPVITMRLLSEERRTGTLEVLLTAPVREVTVVLSKFFAALIFFLVTWIPWVLFLIALRVEGQQPFDYRPVFSFFIVLVVLGAGFVSMGLFLSSLTRNQLVSAVLTFAGMMLATMVSWLKFYVERQSVAAPEEQPWSIVLRHFAYLETWDQSLNGILVPKYLLFYLSCAILGLFLTVKVLEARKWT
jgi:ABC-2 type transport system permease protein